MLIGILAVLSVLAAVGITAAGGWLWWLLPVGFLGSFLVLALLAFLFLWAMCARVDLNTPPVDSPFYRRLLRIYAQAAVTLLQIRYEKTGMEMLPREGRYLLVCNHLSDADPVCLHDCFPKSHLAFISKRENADMFLVGKLMHTTLCQMINRENDREALKTILSCISILKEDRANVAVFPEGYTSVDGLLHPFRSGVFKIAQKADVPIVVVTLQNTDRVFHNAKRLKPTLVKVHLLGVIPARELKGVTAVDIGNRVHKMMEEDLGKDKVFWEENT